MIIRSLFVVAAVLLLAGCDVQVEAVSPIPEDATYSQVNQHARINIFPASVGMMKYGADSLVDTREYYYLKDKRSSIDQIAGKLVGHVPIDGGYRFRFAGYLQRPWWPKESPRAARGAQLNESPHLVEVLIVDHSTYSEMWIYNSYSY